MIEIAPLNEIASFQGTYLLLIILLSLKAESKSVLHSVTFQSYPLSIESYHHCNPFAPPPCPPPPQSYRVPIESQFLSFKRGERKIKEIKKIQISTTIKQLLLTAQTIQRLAFRAIGKNLKNLQLALGSYQLASSTYLHCLENSQLKG